MHIIENSQISIWFDFCHFDLTLGLQYNLFQAKKADQFSKW